MGAPQIQIAPQIAPGDAIRACQRAIRVIGFSHPAFLILHAHAKDKYRETGEIPTMAVDAKGVIYVSPSFVMRTPRSELGGVVAHELLHLALLHGDRELGRDHDRWNEATDMAINQSLRASGIALPSRALYPPSDYRGPNTAEDLYEWLQSSLPPPSGGPGAPGEGEGDGKPGDGPGGPKSIKDATQGCGVLRPGEGPCPQGNAPGTPQDSQGPEVDWPQVAREAREAERSIGSGSGICDLLSPSPARINWRSILRHGFQRASECRGRDSYTYARRSRRSPRVGPQFPGWVGHDPRVAIVIDVSGSMDREWISEIIGECVKLCGEYRSKAYLVTHTDRVTWSGWVKHGSCVGALAEACAFSGGTDAHGAYRAVGDAGKFDALIHFTDCEIGSWPENPARKLVIAAYGTSADCAELPPGAERIPCRR